MANANDAVWISVLPDLSGWSSSFTKQVGPQSEKAGQTMGSRLSSGIGKTLKRGAMVAGGAAIAAIGTSLYKGFSRLQGIDQAEAKLRGLGHSAKGVEGIMDNALAAVKGTAFGLDAAATTAAGAVAAGVKPGQQLERTLKLVADTATIAGVGMDEMGAIFNKVASSDMIQGDVLAQLGDKGIPVLQMLGKEMGVSASEVRKLASQGEVDFATFQNAMEKGLGGAAQESGKTFSGAMANTQAAMGRLGAVVLGPIFQRIPGVLDKAIGRIDDMAPVAEKVGTLLGDGFSLAGQAIQTHVLPPLRTFGGFLRDDVWPVLQDVGGWLKDNTATLKVLAGVIAGAAAAYVVYSATVSTVNAVTKAWTALTKIQTTAQKALNLVLKLNPIGIVVTALVALAAGLVIAYKKSDTFRAIVDKAWSVIRRSVKSAWENAIRPALRAFHGFVQGNLIPVITWLWQNIVRPYFRLIGAAIKAAWTVIKTALSAWWWYMKNILIPAIQFLWDKAVKPVMGFIGRTIRDTWQQRVKPALSAMRDFVVTKLVPAFERARDKVKAFWEGIKNAAKAPARFVIETVWNNGLREMIGKIPGVDTPGRVALGFAAGGWTGPGSKYQPAGIVHADEHVFTKEEARAFPGGHRGLERLRSALRGYANGGRVWPVPGRQISTYAGHDGVDINRGTGWDDFNDPIWAAAPGTVSYVGTGRGYGLATFIRGPYGELVYGHMNTAYTTPGMSVGAGALIGRVGNTGRSSAPHLHFGFPGGTYAQALAFLQGASVTGGDKSPGGGFGGLIKLAKKVWDGIKSMASGGWDGLFKSAAKGAGGDVKDWINGKIPGPGPIPGFLFDQGGWLRPGHAGVNLSGKPEPVFTSDQWRVLSGNLRNSSSSVSAAVAERRGEQAARFQGEVLRRMESLEVAVSRVAPGVVGGLDGVSASAARKAQARGVFR